MGDVNGDGEIDLPEFVGTEPEQQEHHLIHVTFSGITALYCWISQ